MSIHATAVFEVKTWDEKPYQEIEGGSKLTRASVTKAYRGDVTGDGASESLMFYRADGSAVFAGLERIVAAIGGRAGSFVLQVNCAACAARRGTSPRTSITRTCRSRWTTPSSEMARSASRRQNLGRRSTK